MWRRTRILRWPALLATVFLGLGWFLSHRGALWIAPSVQGRVPVFLLMNGVLQFRMDKRPANVALAPSPAGFSTPAPLGLLLYH